MDHKVFKSICTNEMQCELLSTIQTAFIIITYLWLNIFQHTDIPAK